MKNQQTQKKFTIFHNFAAFLLVFLWTILSINSHSAEDPETESQSPINKTAKQQTGETLPPTDKPIDNSNTPSNNPNTTKQATQKRIPSNEKSTMKQRHLSVLNYLKLHQRQREMVKLGEQEQLPFYGFFLQERSGRPQGAVLILHDVAQHAHWPKLVAPLRENLPDYGWITLSIELPQITKTLIKKDLSRSKKPLTKRTDTPSTENNKTAAETNNDEQNNASATTEAPQQITNNPNRRAKYQQQIAQRIDTAIDYLRSRGQFNLVIIGIGQAAIFAVNSTLKLDKKEGLALVIINAKHNPNQDDLLSDKLGKLELPILDLLTEENRSNLLQLQQRRGTMRHLERTDYIQIHLPQAIEANAVFKSTTSSSKTHPIVRRIRGWLRSKAAGTPLKIPRSQAPPPAKEKETKDKPL